VSRAGTLPTPAEAKAELKRELRRATWIILGFIVLIWLIQIVNVLFFGGRLSQLGVLPRTVTGLRGILFMPLLHSDAGHLFSNSIGILLLGGMIVLREERDFWVATVVGALVGGAGTWLLGRSAMHIGASGVIFAYLGYLLFTGWFERRAGAVLLSIGSFLLWGGLVFGVLPTQPGISWEGHLFGLVGGVVAARLLARHKAKA
jgi:membrane associated rhomboid family serine protease